MIIHLTKLTIFYNRAEEPEDQFLSLWYTFACGSKDMEPDIEVKVRTLNINYGKNKRLMEDCSNGNPLF